MSLLGRTDISAPIAPLFTSSLIRFTLYKKNNAQVYLTFPLPPSTTSRLLSLNYEAIKKDDLKKD